MPFDTIAPYLVLTIVNRTRLKKIEDFFESENVHLHYICLGFGTASSDMLDVLGLGSTDVACVVSFAPRHYVKEFFENIIYKLDLQKRGNGVTASIPISGVSSPLMQLLESAGAHTAEKEVDYFMQKHSGEHAFSLVVAVVNHGFSEKVLAAAKEQGAGGGTIIHARRGGEGKAESFFGISITTEKEIVLMLTPFDKKAAVMKAIGRGCGMSSDAHGVIFSLPVEDVAGLSAESPQ